VRTEISAERVVSLLIDRDEKDVAAARVIRRPRKQTSLPQENKVCSPAPSGHTITCGTEFCLKTGARFTPSAERRADILDVVAQPAMCWIGIQPRVPEQ